jgi:hypothetical protein
MVETIDERERFKVVLYGILIIQPYDESGVSVLGDPGSGDFPAIEPVSKSMVRYG